MKQLDLLLAEKLLKINAINLQPDNPFMWASGWYSPIYTDSRRALSYPDTRTFIKIQLSRLIFENIGSVDAIAGVATGAIAYGALVADELMRPYVYVRTEPKDHGLENVIEGNLRPGMRVVVIEDVISTGQTAKKIIEEITNAGCQVVGIIAIFNYQFPESKKIFSPKRIPLLSLTNYTAMKKAGEDLGYLLPEDVETLDRWHNDPAEWIPVQLD